jgi:hypothetical protein
MVLFKNQLILIGIAIATGFVACGDRDRPDLNVERTSGDSFGIAEVPCVKGSCPSVPLYIDGPNGSSQVLGNLDQDNSIRFSAKAEQAASRQIKMRVYYGPDQCKNNWSGQDSAEVSCSWRPNDLSQSGKIKAIARDVSYCLEKYKQSASCQDMSKSIPDVDKEQEFQYSVEDNAPQMIDPAFIENPGPQYGANGGLRGCGMGMLSGVIGVLQGSFMPAVMGCVNGYIGGLQQTQAYPNNNASGSIIGGSGTNGLGTNNSTNAQSASGF